MCGILIALIKKRDIELRAINYIKNKPKGFILKIKGNSQEKVREMKLKKRSKIENWMYDNYYLIGQRSEINS